jgi:hypothetical protein
MMQLPCNVCTAAQMKCLVVPLRDPDTGRRRFYVGAIWRPRTRRWHATRPVFPLWAVRVVRHMVVD